VASPVDVERRTDNEGPSNDNQEDA
jgi:hypothetical protein